MGITAVKHSDEGSHSGINGLRSSNAANVKFLSMLSDASNACVKSMSVSKNTLQIAVVCLCFVRL